jgi:hypothetical protein
MAGKNQPKNRANHRKETEYKPKIYIYTENERKAEESHRSALPLSSSLQEKKRTPLNQRLLTTSITIVYWPSSRNHRRQNTIKERNRSPSSQELINKKRGQRAYRGKEWKAFEPK